MAPLPPHPRSPSPARLGDFSYKRAGLRVLGDVQYTSPERLKQMDSYAGGLRPPNVTGIWIRGQLEYYAIFYQAYWTEDELAHALEEAVRNGEVSDL